MDFNILICGFLMIVLILFAVQKWAFKGEIFHPVFLFILINSGMFVIFAFGFHSYKYSIGFDYHYYYIVFIYEFAFCMIWGIKNGQQQFVQEIKLKSANLSTLYLFSICLGLFVVVPLILVTGGSIEQAVTNRFESFDQGAEAIETNSTNPLMFIVNNLISSLRQITGCIVFAHCLQENKKYQRVFVLLLLMVLESIYSNSRTLLLFGLAIFVIPAYLKFKNLAAIGFTKIQWQRFIRYSLIIILVVLVFIGFLTNIRSSVRTADSAIPYENLEILFDTERKPWFQPLSDILPVSIMNPLVQLSLYASSTIAIGGGVTNIAFNNHLNTLGLRTLAPLYRIIDRLSLAPDISSQASENLKQIWEIGGPLSVYGWWGVAANYIVDFGLIGGFLVAGIIGWIIGWIYGRISTSGFVVQSTVSVILFNAMLLTPAVNPFGYFPSFFSLIMIITYILTHSYKSHRPSVIVDSDRNKY